MEVLRFVVALGIFLFGAYFTGKLRGVPLREAFARGAAQAPGALSPAAALSSALCGTLGVGTVLAAISALAEGGPGVLLPLLVGTLTGCALKYAEILVTMRHRQSGLAGRWPRCRNARRAWPGPMRCSCCRWRCWAWGTLRRCRCSPRRWRVGRTFRAWP